MPMLASSQAMSLYLSTPRDCTALIELLPNGFRSISTLRRCLLKVSDSFLRAIRNFRSAMSYSSVSFPFASFATGRSGSSARRLCGLWPAKYLMQPMSH